MQVRTSEVTFKRKQTFTNDSRRFYVVSVYDDLG